MEYIYVERQRFRQWWLWLILIVVNGLIAYRNILLLWGDPTSIGLWLSLIALSGVTVFIAFITLETRINKQGIEVRFFPFHFSFIKISWNQILNAEVREYNPLKEYGGWGLRYGASGKAYNVSGKTGIQLMFKDGTSLLIGTNRREEAEEVLRKVKSNNL